MAESEAPNGTKMKEKKGKRPKQFSEVKFTDKREKRIVYISRCLLNQNLRFPGIAVSGGMIAELIALLIQNNIGIEQLPCLEFMEWGGVSRKAFFKYQPIVTKYVDSRLFWLVKPFIKIWLFNFSRICKKEAIKVVDQIEDFINAGYSILSIIAMNDSPTCGVTKTIDIIESAAQYKLLGFTKEDLENVQLDTMREMIPSLCKEGSGLFMSPVIRELEKRNINIKIIGFNPWVNLNQEVQRINEILKNQIRI